MEPFSYVIEGSLIPKKKFRKYLSNTKKYDVSISREEWLETTLLDTFDDEVALNAKLLAIQGTQLVLVDLVTGGVEEQEVQGDWSFAEELSPGPVAEALLKVSKLRAFLPIAEIELRWLGGALLDDELKTRARFHAFELAHGKKTITVGTTSNLRGYQKAHADLITVFKQAGARSLEKDEKIYNLLGLKKRNYCAKPELPLQPGTYAKKTATTIIDSFSAIARRNEPGIIKDYDTEFLHDYRVSFRKVRSVLSLFKNVYSKEQTLYLKKEFAAIMQSTNKLRDLDVYLLERDTYFKMVPESSKEGLGELFNYIERQRIKELKKVAKTLKSRSYKERVEGLQLLFTDPTKLESGSRAKQPAKQFGSNLILRRYEQVCRIANSIDANTEDAVVHELRISCKKLRYLMEFFTPMFPGGQIKSLIKSLKVLQDNLGNFNDYSVQQEFLRQVLNEDLSLFKDKELQVTESIGALTAMLYRLQLKERKQVVKNFERFDSVETRALFRELFQTKGEKE